MIRYRCPACGAAMSSPASMGGRVERCPACSAACRVPVPTAPAQADAPGPQAISTVEMMRLRESVRQPLPPPPAAPSPPPASARQPQPPVVIERTAKTLKAQLLAASLIMGTGLLALLVLCGTGGLVDNPAGTLIAAALAALGLIWSLAVRFSIWWHHG